MKKVALVIIILLMPVYAWAEYTIFLKNGSVIPNVRSYYESSGDLTVYFGTGSMVVPRQDVLRIEGFEPVEQESDAEDSEPLSETPEPRQEGQRPEEPAGGERLSVSESPAGEQTSDKAGRLSEIKTELNNVYSEFRQLEEEEGRLVAEINEKRSSRVTYNKIQLNQLMKETEPVQEKLFSVQKRKEELRQTRNSLENEAKALE